MAESEVAMFREQQALQEQAAQAGLHGLAVVASHESITKRVELGAERLLELIQQGKHAEVAQIMETTTWGQ
jgi:hypothetical protein